MHRSKNTLALAGVMTSLCLFATDARADAPLRVRWDCYLEGAAIGCNALANAYAESTPGVALDAGAGDLEVRVRSIDVTPRRRYLVEVTRPGDAPSTLRLARAIANSRGGDQTLLDVLALLHRGTLPFLDVSAPGRVEGASFVLRGGAIHEPADADGLDPVATLLAGSDFGRLTVEAELSLSCSFGNGALRTQDRRWR